MFRTGSPYSPFFTSGLLQPTRRGSFPSDPDAFYFTLRDDYRSFLSLDLAESQSLPTVRRNKVPQEVTSIQPSLRLRRSRDSIRTIPSPKPAPSITLPEVPKSSSAPPRLPSIPISPSIHLSVVSPVVTDPSKRNSTVTVSPSIRKINRSHALARLEGRTNFIRRKPKPIKRNFMSMSDEESEADDDDDDFDTKYTLDVINEPEDLVLPPPLSGQKMAPIGGRFPSSVRTKSAVAPSPRKRRTKTKDWFPLKSFIDLQTGDDDSKRFSWRSFIEVARVS